MIRLAARYGGMLRDVYIILVGVGTLAVTPPSLGNVGAEFYVAKLWSMLFVIGGLACLIGLHRRWRQAEMVGCSMVSAAFSVWTLTALFQSDASIVSYTIAAVFAYAGLSTLLRGLVVLSGLLPADRGV